MEVEPKNITLVVQGENFLVDARITSVSKMIEDVSGLFPDQPIPIEGKFELTTELMTTVVKYCQMHNYVPPEYKGPMKSAKLEENLDPKDYEFIKNYAIKGDNRLKNLINAASYLQIQSLFMVCIVRIATEFYCSPDQDSFENIKKKHGIEKDLTIELAEDLEKKHLWLLNS